MPVPDKGRAQIPAAQPPVANRQDQVFPATRWLATFIIPFLIAAWVILYIFPHSSAELFAWPIRPSMSARLMGSGYLAGAYFFLRAAAGKSWRQVKNGFLPVAIFAVLMALTTFLHWSRFTHGHIAFLTWVTLYITTPLLVLAAWLRNRSADKGFPSPRDATVPRLVRWTMGCLGSAMIFAVLVFYSNPQRMMAIWPWTLTPLTARACLGFFLLPAITEVTLAADSRWSAHRLIIQGQVVALAFILIGAALSWADFSPPGARVFTGSTALILFANLAYSTWMENKTAATREA